MVFCCVYLFCIIVEKNGRPCFLFLNLFEPYVCRFDRLRSSRWLTEMASIGVPYPSEMFRENSHLKSLSNPFLIYKPSASINFSQQKILIISFPQYLQNQKRWKWEVVSGNIVFYNFFTNADPLFCICMTESPVICCLKSNRHC